MEKQRWEEIERRRKKVRRSEKRKSQKKEDAGARKGSKIAIHYGFPMICGSEGLKNRLVRSHVVGWEMKKCTPLRREAHWEVRMYKAHQSRSTSGSWHVEKVHVVVVRSRFPSQNVKNIKNTTCQYHSWRFRCGLCGRRKGFCPWPKVSKTWWFCSMSLHYTPLHSITLHYATVNYATLHYTKLHYTTTRRRIRTRTTTIHYVTLHHTTLHPTTFNYATLYTTLHYTTLHYTSFNYTALRYTTLHLLQLHHATLH